MKLPVFVGVSVPVGAGPSAWHIEGALPTGEQAVLTGYSKSRDRGELVLSALNSLLRNLEEGGDTVTELVVTAFRDDLGNVLQRPALHQHSAAKLFETLTRGLEVTWNLKPVSNPLFASAG